jgi:ferrochelatase
MSPSWLRWCGMARTAVVLFNLGGPDGPETIEPFLFNLFRDPAIIAVPQPFRWLLAKLIARRRAAVASGIYAKIGGGSPLLANTAAQARALEAALGPSYRCFIAMRYWHPFARAAVQAVADWQPERIILLPLYPQFSTTTTASSLGDWRREAARAGLTAPTLSVCCYPSEPGFTAAASALTEATLASVPGGRPVRVLFSAHGLPKKVVRAGDPYQAQVEMTAAAIAARLDRPGLDTVVCYQSRVGPLEWIGPSTDAEIARAGRDGVGIVVVPIAFVSEHSETLVELDIEYRHLAERNNVSGYWRVPTVGAHPEFIAGLARLVHDAERRGREITSSSGERLCPKACTRCAIDDAPARLVA